MAFWDQAFPKKKKSPIAEAVSAAVAGAVAGAQAAARPLSTVTPRALPPVDLNAPGAPWYTPPQTPKASKPVRMSPWLLRASPGFGQIPVPSEAPRNFTEELSRLLSGVGVQATHTAGQSLPSLALKIPEKPKLYPERKASDPFRGKEYKELESREIGLLAVIAREEREYKTTLSQPPTEERAAELHKRAQVERSRNEELSTIRALKRTLEGELKTKFLQSIGREPDKEDAKHFLQWQVDQQDLLRKNMHLLSRRTELIQQSPAITQGTAKPEHVAEMADIERKLSYNRTLLEISSDYQKHRELVERKEITESPYGDRMNEAMLGRAQAARAAAQAAGAVFPEEIEMFLGQKPEDFEKSVWDSWSNPWKWAFELGRNSLKLADVPAQALGGGAYGLYESLVLNQARKRAGNLGGGFGGGGSLETNAPPLQAPYAEDAIGTEAQRIAAEHPEMEEATNPLMGFLIGAGRGALQPWTGEPAGISQLLHAAGESGMPGFGWGRNPVANALASAAWSIGWDPLNYIAMPGTLTRRGRDIKDIATSARKAELASFVDDTVTAQRHAQHAYDVARRSGLVEDLGDLGVEKMIALTRDIQRAPTAAERIRAGEQVALGLRSPANRRMAVDMPDWLRAVQAKATKPFSRGMEAIRGTELAKGVASSRGFGSKLLMTPEMREVNEAAEFLARMGTGRNVQVAREVVKRSKGVDLGRVDDLLRGRQISNVTGAERALADYIRDAYSTGRLREIMAGQGTSMLGNLAGELYQPGITSNLGKETLRDLVRNTLERTKPYQSRVRTFQPERFSPDQLKIAVEGATGIAPQGETVPDILKELRSIRKTSGVPVFGKQPRNLDWFIDRLSGKTPKTVMRGPWEATPTRIPGGALADADWFNLEKVLTESERLARFGPGAGINPAQSLLQRLATGEADVAANALRRYLGERFGYEHLAELGYSADDVRKMRAAGRLGEAKWTTSRMLDEPLPYFENALDTEAVRAGQVSLFDEPVPRGYQYSNIVPHQAPVPRSLLQEAEHLIHPTGQSWNALTRSIGRKHDELLNFWKGQATALRPGFHARNYLSNIWQLHLADAAHEFFDPRTRWAYRQMRKPVGAKPGLFTSAGEKLAPGFKKMGLTYDDLRRMALSENILTSGRYSEQGMREVDKLIRAAGAHGQVIEGISNILHPTRPEWGPMALGRWVGRNIENKPRGISFLAGLKQTGSPALAGDMPGKFLFNYDELSRLDRAIRRGGVPFWCLPDTAEALTREGWKHHSQLHPGDDILTLNVTSSKLEWSPVRELFAAPYNGQMVSLEGKSLKTTCTPNHRWVAENVNRGKRFEEAWKLRKHDRIQILGDYDQADYPISDDALWAISWIVSDGYCRMRGRHFECMIYQSPEKHVDEIRERLEPYDYSESIHPDSGVICFHINGDFRKEIHEHLSRKEDYLPLILRLSRRQLDIAFDVFVKAEGTIARAGTSRECIQITQRKDPFLRDAVQLLCYLRGSPCKLGSKGVYVRKPRKYIKALNLNPAIVDYKGTVWCPVTGNHTWVARDNGFVFATGNTWQRKNVPLQIEQLIKQPQKYHHLLQALGALRQAGLDKFGEKVIEAGEKIMPSYMQDMPASLLPGSYMGMPLYLNPNIPPQDLMKLRSYINPFSEDNAGDVLFQFNPLAKIPLSLMINASTKGDMLGRRPAPVPPWFAQGVNAVEEMLGQKPSSKVASDIYNPALQTWYANPAYLWAAKQASPALSDLIGLTQTNRTDMPFQYLSRLGGVKVLPYDAMKAAKDLEYEGGEAYDEAKRWLKQLGADVEVEGYKNPETKVPTSPSTLKSLLKYNELPITQQNLDRLKAELEKVNIYSPMPWGTLEDVVNAGKRGYVYSYNRAMMTPEQIAAAEAAGRAGGGRGGGGRRGGGGGRAPKLNLKPVRVKKAGRKISSVGEPDIVTALSSMAPMPIPAEASTAQGHTAMDALNAAIQQQVAQRGRLGGFAGATTGGVMSAPADVMAALQQILAGFAAGRGGVSPATLAALRAMLEQQGALSPQAASMLENMGGPVA